MNLYKKTTIQALADEKIQESLTANFEKHFGYPAECLFSVPGRSELGGNHTDHQNGHVLACAVTLYIRAAAAKNGTDKVRICSEGFGLTELSVTDLDRREEEKNTTIALVRGILSFFKGLGADLSGFDVYAYSEVPAGSGLSSSAAFEVLIAKITDTFFHDEQLDPVILAKIGQYAENTYFGKPCGLMDQTACAVGGVIGINFFEGTPEVEKTEVNLSAYGYRLYIVETGGGHEDLTDEYAAIPNDMSSVARFFKEKHLSRVDELDFFDNITSLRERFSDRAVLRAFHFFEEDKRAVQELHALKNGRWDLFLNLVNASGRSSFMYLQNVIPAGNVKSQPVAVALKAAEYALHGRGAYRVHGGGFAGTIQAFVPEEEAAHFEKIMEHVIGQNCCRSLSVDNDGCSTLWLS